MKGKCLSLLVALMLASSWEVAAPIEQGVAENDHQIQKEAHPSASQEETAKVAATKCGIGACLPHEGSVQYERKGRE